MIDFQNLIHMQMQNNQSFRGNSTSRKSTKPRFFSNDNEVKKTVQNHQQNIATQR